MHGSADLLTFRAPLPDDLAFVKSSWAKSYYDGNPFRRWLTPEDFHGFHRPQRDRFFAKPNTTVIVCADSTDINVIVGWIAVEVIPAGFILQYIYVKSDFKKQGIARELVSRAIPSSKVFYTHITGIGKTIMRKDLETKKEMAGYRYVPHLV